jgi:hypothetical protein
MTGELTAGEGQDIRAPEAPSPSRAAELDRYASRGLWALPIWALLLFLGTLTHQPDPKTDFAAFARYVTTTEFLLSHIFASIVGAAIGALGFVALFVVLALRVRARLAGMVMAVAGSVVDSAIFGMAAFGQPAAGRAYLAGQTQEAPRLYNDMYGVPLFSTAGGGILLLVVGVVLLGIAIARSRLFPRWLGIVLAIAIVVFGVLGVILADIVQSIGAVLLIVSTAGLAYTGIRRTALAERT